MQVRAAAYRLPWGARRKQPNEDGRRQNREGMRLDPALKPQGGATIPRIHRVLPVLHPRVFSHRPTAARPHQTGDPLALGRTTAACVRHPQGVNVRQARLTAAGLREGVLPADRHLSIWGRGHPILRRRNNDVKLTECQTLPTPHSILLKHLYPHGAKLQHL